MNNVCEYCSSGFTPSRPNQRFCSVSHAVKFRYANGFVAHIEAAHKTLREKGHYKRDNTYLVERNPGATVVARRKISKAKVGVPVPKLQGKNHPRWNGGKDKTIWKSKEYQAWRKSVMRRDNYTCTHCGDNRGGNLEADHIKPRYLYPELTFDIENGRTLCKDCHKATPTWGTKVKKLQRADA